MITAERLIEIISLSPSKLTELVGAKDLQFQTAKFLGLTNGGEFCFDAGHVKDGDLMSTKVFVRVTDGKITAIT